MIRKSFGQICACLLLFFVKNLLTENDFYKIKDVTYSLPTGQHITSYSINITAKEDTFEGQALLVVDISTENRGKPIKLHFQDLELNAVYFGITNLNRPNLIKDVTIKDGILEITPPIAAFMYMFNISYSGKVRNDGVGLYRGVYDEGSYLAMNLYPIHARKVFPCMDELILNSEIRMTFKNEIHKQITGNSINEGSSNVAEFLPIFIPPSLWGLVAHDFLNIVLPHPNIDLHAPFINQSTYVSQIIPNILNFLNEWTNTPYFDISPNHGHRLHIFALPDVNRDWQAISTVGIWEPYILATANNSLDQRIKILTAVSEGIAKQWFGYVIYPQNWRFAWITTGLQILTAYEAASEADADIDVNSIFLTEIIQESMLRDSFTISQTIEPENNLFHERNIKDHLNGILKFKAGALMRMLKIVLKQEEIDILRNAASNLLQHRSLRHVTSFNFYDSINGIWFFIENPIINNVACFIRSYVHNTGYPVLNIDTRSGGVNITQERFGFREVEQINYPIPLTYTTVNNPDFENIYPFLVLEDTSIIYDIELGVNDWVIFNIQGQGYYRVNYDLALWNNLIEAMSNKTTRDIIHPLNRASLLDDALNLARAGKLGYDVALPLTVAMGLELHYGPWKTFVRNMNFLKKQLNAFVQENDDLDPNIYTILVNKTFLRFEEEIGFVPDEFVIEDPMIPRGLVMEHACQANYTNCIELANELFFEYYNENETVINTQIHPEIRPAVFCTVVREDKEGAIDALWELYIEEQSHYERIVILKSFACSLDRDFVWNLLVDTLNDDGIFRMEERVIFYEAVAESHLENTVLALRFIRLHIDEIRAKYGGPRNLDRIILTLGDNLVTHDLVESLETWIEAINTDIGDSEYAARQALLKAKDNLYWRERHVNEVYTWILQNLNN